MKPQIIDPLWKCELCGDGGENYSLGMHLTCFTLYRAHQAYPGFQKHLEPIWRNCGIDRAQKLLEDHISGSLCELCEALKEPFRQALDEQEKVGGWIWDPDWPGKDTWMQK